MKPFDFTRENRLPWQAILFLIGKGIKKVAKEFWPLGVWVYYRILQDRFTPFVGILLSVLLLLFISVIRGVMLYRNFSYVVKDRQLIIRKGIFKKETLTIPLQSIQNVQILQSFWQRVLQITTLSADTAGTKDKEFEVYLDLATSNALKQHLYAERLVFTDSADGVPPPLSAEQEEIWAKQRYRYSVTQLFKAGITRNHIKSFWLSVALFLSFVTQLDEEYRRLIADEATTFLHEIHTVMYALLFAVSIFVLITLVNFIHTCLKHYQLTAVLYEDKVKYERGLLNRVEQVVHLSKIQVVRQTRNWLEKAMKLSSLELFQFSMISVKKSKADVSFAFPGFLHSDECTAFILPDVDKEQCFCIQAEKNYRTRNFRFIALFPVLIIALGALYRIEFLIAAVVWCVIGTGLALLKSSKAKAEIGNTYLRLHSGMLGDVMHTFAIHKVQRVHLRQSVFQARKGTASLVIGTHWRSFTISFIRQEIAWQLYDYLLYKIESRD